MVVGTACRSVTLFVLVPVPAKHLIRLFHKALGFVDTVAKGGLACFDFS